MRLRLAQLLKARRMTRYALAKASGLRAATVYALARPDGRFERLDRRTLETLCDTLKVTPGELLHHTPRRAR